MYGNPSGKPRLRLSFNSPVVLSFAALCVLARIAGVLTGGESDALLFSVYRAPLRDPLTWVRCFTHVLGHTGWDHLLGNMMYILLLGPLVEEKYGPLKTFLIILAAAGVTGIISMAFFPGVMLMGASGVAFAFILGAAVTVREDRTIPVTFILVAVLYLGQQVYQGIFVRDNVSQTAHIAGGIVGAVLGFIPFRRGGRKKRL